MYLPKLLVLIANREDVLREYQPREPEKSVLYGVLQENLETFYANLEADPDRKGLPAHVKKELEAFLKCGIAAYGFLRLQCNTCKKTKILPYACKGRGFCPSCCGRRMCETSIHLVDHVFPLVPIRQYVLSFPFQIRYFLAYKPDLVTKVFDIYTKVISAFIRKKARDNGVKDGTTGAVTIIQRAGSAAGNLNVHFHGLFIDGVFTIDPVTNRPKFHRVRAPSAEEVLKIVSKIAARVMKLLIKEGLIEEINSERLLDESAFHDCVAASVGYRIATGPRKGQRLRFLGGIPGSEEEGEVKGDRCATNNGFSLHANTAISAKNRNKLEHLVRYIARPPLADGRLVKSMFDNKIVYHMKRAFADGTSAVVLEPLELVEKIAALVPPPWGNLTRYSGCFAARYKYRMQVVLCPIKKGEKRRPEWAEILKRIFKVDALKCETCGGKLKIISAINKREAIVAILKSLGRSYDAPPIIPARAPPREEFDWGA